MIPRGTQKKKNSMSGTTRTRDEGITDAEGGSEQLKSRYERQGERRRERGLRLHDVALEIRIKKNEKCDTHEMRDGSRDSRTDSPTKILTGSLCTVDLAY